MSFCDMGNRGHKIEIWVKKIFLTTRFIAEKKSHFWEISVVDPFPF